MNPGDKVFHSQLGEGKVIRVISHGDRVWVNFGYLTDRMPCDELKVLNCTEPPPAFCRSEGDIAAIGEDIVDARRAVLALKLGQVPENGVLELSSGTDGERDKLAAAIDSVCRKTPASILVKGAWGTGKTHLLTMLRALAARRRLATASVILDLEGVTLSDPMGLMADILDSLRFPGEAVADSIMSRLLSFRRRYRGPIDDDGVIDAVFRIPQKDFEDPEVKEVLVDYFRLRLPAYRANERLRRLGRSVTLRPLIARRVVERADRFCDLLRGWAQVCLFTEESTKGIVVVIDELDVDYYRTSRNTDQNMKLRRRRQMLLEAFGSLQNRSIPLLLAFGMAPATDDVEENDAVVDLRQSIDGIIEIDAPMPNGEQTRQIGKRLLDLYARAYPDRMAGVDRVRLIQFIDAYTVRHHDDAMPIPRTFVRGTLELLDVAIGD